MSTATGKHKLLCRETTVMPNTYFTIMVYNSHGGLIYQYSSFILILLTIKTVAGPEMDR